MKLEPKFCILGFSKKFKMAAPRRNMITIKILTARPLALEERLLKNIHNYISAH
jgi:hypothetical protein